MTDPRVPLVEAERRIARHLSGEMGDTFAPELRREAAGILLRALREGSVDSWGVPADWPDQRKRRALTPSEWQTLEAMIDDCGLRPANSQRRGRVDWIEEIEVDAKGIEALISELALTARSPVAGQIQEIVSPDRSSLSKLIKPAVKLLRPAQKKIDDLIVEWHSNGTVRTIALDFEAAKAVYPGVVRTQIEKARNLVKPEGGFKPGPKGPRLE